MGIGHYVYIVFCYQYWLHPWPEIQIIKGHISSTLACINLPVIRTALTLNRHGLSLLQFSTAECAA